MNKKNILLISVAIATLIIFSIIIWYFFIRKEVAPPVLNISEQKAINYQMITSNVLEDQEIIEMGVDEKMIERLFPKQPTTPKIPNPYLISKPLLKNILTPSPSDDGNLIFFFNIEDGALYSYNLLQKDTKILNRLQSFLMISDIKWNRMNSPKVILYDKIYSPDNIDFLEDPEDDKASIEIYIYNIISNNFIELNKRIRDVAWLNDNQIIYHYYDEQNNSNFLSKSNFDQTNFENLLELGQIPYPDMFKIAGTSNNKVYFSYYLDEIRSYVLDSYDINSKNVSRLLNRIIDNNSICFSKSGNKAIIQILSPDPELIIFYMNDNYLEKLNIDVNISKIAWGNDEETIFYAQSENVDFAPDGSLNYASTDSFWKFNTQTQTKEQLTNLDIDNGIDATNLFISPQQDKLYFLNSRDNSLYYIDLLR